MRDALRRELAARRPVVAETPVLRRLADRLIRFLERFGDGAIYLPDTKALLSRDGGVCPDDGARLVFDPWEPHRHRCPACAGVVQGERHDRAWVVPYHIWLSERAVHAALLGTLRSDASLARLAARIVTAYAACYRNWPNRDNVLGPSRPFFSTYLEAIWLAQLALAVALLEAADAPAPEGARQLLEESAELIASFPEGLSNRQAWNAAALIAAGAVLGRDDLVERGARGRWGLETLLRAGVGREGLWHEGENYHLFALRGLALAAELLRWHDGADYYRAGPLRAMFAAPLATLLPDLTLPARGDAPYGVSVRQPRFAELWEWGRARAADRRLAALLAELYGDDAPEADDEGWRELAEQERNRPAHRQYRDRLGWKALLWMRADPPPAGGPPWRAGAVAVTEHGVCVLRPEAERYVSVEAGARRGGHQHPDLLHLTLYWGRAVLMDLGTGSYVSPSLHWYRSTEAHNAPGVPGAGQPGTQAWCAAADADQGWAWCHVLAPALLGPDTAVWRTVIAGPRFVVDVVDVEAPAACVVELPLHPLGTDAFRLHPRAGEEVLERRAPGPPGPDFADGAPRTYRVRRAAGSGRWVQVYDPERIVRVVTEEPSLDTTEGRYRFARRGDVLEVVRDGRRLARLAGRRTRPPAASPPAEREPPPRVAVPVLPVPPSLEAWPRSPVFRLAANHYRRSEMPYDALPDPLTAQVGVGVHGSRVAFWVAVTKASVVIRPAGAADPALDNEPADIHSDGVQCYVGRDAWTGWLVVPEFPSGIRVRPVSGTAAAADAVTGAARRTVDGYEVLVVCDTGRPFGPGDRFRFTVSVNEMRAERERRAGQLALAGGGWIYLRGDREAADGAFIGEVT